MGWIVFGVGDVMVVIGGIIVVGNIEYNMEFL